MGMTLTKDFVNHCRNVGALRDFLCQAIDQVDEKDKEIAEIKQRYNDMDTAHTVHIAKMNAKIEELESNERRLKMALWLARAKRADEIHFMWCQLIYDKKYGIEKFNVRKEFSWNLKKGQVLHTPQGWADVWADVEYKCRAMAEKFK